MHPSKNSSPEKTQRRNVAPTIVQSQSFVPGLFVYARLKFRLKGNYFDKLEKMKKNVMYVLNSFSIENFQVGLKG